MILVDAHVHIYDCFDLTKFFDSAYLNFKTEAEKIGHAEHFTGILLLAETSRDNWFQHLSGCADGKKMPDDKKAATWKFHLTDEPESIYARSGRNYEIILIAGRQIISEEGLELLALGTTASFSDGTPIEELIEIVQEKDGLPVIPWGFGKWIGRRGEVLKNLIQTAKKDADFFLGDNGGRPFFWPRPDLFKKGETKGIRVLPGSDPLPLANELHRVGKFGLMISGILSAENSARDLKQILISSPGGFLPYGRLERPFRFFYNQLRLRF